jgi:hypothetical protein
VWRVPYRQIYHHNGEIISMLHKCKHKLKKAIVFIIAHCVVIGELISFVCLDEFACRLGWVKEFAHKRDIFESVAQNIFGKNFRKTNMFARIIAKQIFLRKSTKISGHQIIFTKVFPVFLIFIVFVYFCKSFFRKCKTNYLQQINQAGRKQ